MSDAVLTEHKVYLEVAEDIVDKYCRAKFLDGGDAEQTRTVRRAEHAGVYDLNAWARSITAISSDGLSLGFSSFKFVRTNRHMPDLIAFLASDGVIADELQVTGVFGMGTVPAAVKLAATKLATALYVARQDPNVIVDEASGTRVEYSAAVMNMPVHWHLLLNPYVRVYEDLM